MTLREQAFSFRCGDDDLPGIIAQDGQSAATGVLLVVGGPQYRVGSHRQFLLLSRALAVAAYPVMRFDYRGMGDADGEMRDFEQVDGDIGAAIDAFFARQPGLQRVVLWGLCDAASASLLYWEATRDPRVQGLCLLNPWVRSEASLAQTHIKHYYGQRLLQPEFWRKLFSGRLGLGKALAGFLASLRQAGRGRGDAATADYRQRMAQALAAFGAPVLFVLSGQDYTAKEFLDVAGKDAIWRDGFARPGVSRCDIDDADHTFSSAEGRKQVEHLTRGWLDQHFGPAADS